MEKSRVRTPPPLDVFTPIHRWCMGLRYLSRKDNDRGSFDWASRPYDLIWRYWFDHGLGSALRALIFLARSAVSVENCFAETAT